MEDKLPLKASATHTYVSTINVPGAKLNCTRLLRQLNCERSRQFSAVGVYNIFNTALCRIHRVNYQTITTVYRYTEQKGYTERSKRDRFWRHVRYVVVCNVRAPYSAGGNFRQCFYAIWYLGHPLTFK